MNFKARPAEATGALAGTGGVVAAVAAHNWLAVGLACVGYVPAVVTFVVAHGGIRGVARTLWGGRAA